MEVTPALIPPGDEIFPCWLDVGHEGGQVIDPAVLSIPCLVVDAICPNSFPVEKVDAVGVWFGGNVERRASLPFMLPGAEEINADFEFVLDCTDLIVGD